MSVIFVLLPVAVALAIGGVAAFIWAVRRGQFDDLDTPPVRVLFDDEEEHTEGQHPMIPGTDEAGIELRSRGGDNFQTGGVP